MLLLEIDLSTRVVWGVICLEVGPEMNIRVREWIINKLTTEIQRG